MNRMEAVAIALEELEAAHYPEAWECAKALASLLAVLGFVDE